jgi:hypothetical protein
MLFMDCTKLPKIFSLTTFFSSSRNVYVISRLSDIWSLPSSFLKPIIFNDIGSYYQEEQILLIKTAIMAAAQPRGLVSARTWVQSLTPKKKKKKSSLQ